mmetsp:Transcript_1695/g.3088  ORF Transcript_1695/g.3088 Transcript_1695/m.3088 type:complete len:252 (+) Transcript_1695:115-870(+)
MDSSSIEHRLNALESLLEIKYNCSTGGKSSAAIEEGDSPVLSSGDNSTNTDDVNLQSRLDTLIESTISHLGRHEHLETKLDEIDKLGNELCPSGLFLHSSMNTSSQSALALCGAYRKQEILVRYQELTEAFELLEKIRDLLIISNPSLVKKLQMANGPTSGGGGGGFIGEGVLDDIMSAPILANSSFAFAADPKNRKRLGDLTNEVLMMREKSLSLSKRLDDMIDYYYSAMSKMNEKMVLLQEEIVPRKTT